MITDLRRTLGWRLTAHARSAARSRGFNLQEILLTAADPEVVYTAYDYGPDREVRQRGDVAVVVDSSSEVIVTVLWRHLDSWTDSEVLAARTSTPSLP
jgi:phage-related baseplate assembly protein